MSTTCLNGWNSTLQAAWYIRHVRIIWFLLTKPTIWLLILSFTQNIVQAFSTFYPYEGYTRRSVTPLDAARVNRTVFHNHSVHWYYITLIRVGIILSTILLKSIVFMFTDGVKFNTSVVFFNQNCSGLCHIYSWFLSMWWVLSLSVLLSICRVYIYVRLIMSSYLLFCLVYYMLSKWKEALHVG